MATTKEFAGRYQTITRDKVPLAANVKALKGTQAVLDARTGNATKGYYKPAVAGAGLKPRGRFNETVDNTGGANGDKTVEVLFHRAFDVIWWLNDTGTPVTVASRGGPCYFKDNVTVTGSPVGSSVAGTVYDVVGDYVLVEPVADAALPEGTDADGVAIDDAGTLFASADVEGALAELAKNKAQINLPLTSFLDAATGALLAVFADGASATPGTQMTNSKTASIRWNNHATPGAIVGCVAMPQDLDEASDVEIHFLVSKVGATVGDATVITVGAFEQTVAALHDADADFGGDTGAVVGNAATKTVTELSATLALANVHAPPSAMTFTIKPKAGTLGTDDFLIHAAWLEYTRKNIAA